MRLPSPLPLCLIFTVGCIGTFSFPGFQLDTDDDDTAADDDDSVDDDDATADDDDSATGGPVFCGLEVSPPAGSEASVYTGGADWLFDFEGGALLFDVVWDGCEAKHFWDDTGDVLCGILWRGVGEAYVAQFQANSLVVRFRVDYVLEQNSCGGKHPDAVARTAYYRVDIPYEDGEITLLTGPEPQTPISQMDLWATVPYVGQGDEPDSISIDYATEFTTGG